MERQVEIVKKMNNQKNEKKKNQKKRKRLSRNRSYFNDYWIFIYSQFKFSAYFSFLFSLLGSTKSLRRLNMPWKTSFFSSILRKRSQRKNNTLPPPKIFKPLESKKSPNDFGSQYKIFHDECFLQKNSHLREKTSQTLPRNQKGFVLIFILTFTPLLISLFFCMRLLFLFLKVHQQSHFLCQKELLNSQFKTLKQLKKLFSLNAKAKNLQMKRKRAEENLKSALATGDPFILSKAQIALLQIQTAQNLFHRKQKYHLHKIQILMNEPKTRLKNTLKESEALLSSYLFFSNEPAISPHPPHSASPTYKPDWNFSEKQTIKALWTFDLKSLVGKDIQNFLQSYLSPKFSLSGKCGATIIRPNRKPLNIREFNRRQKWTSTLVKVNVF